MLGERVASATVSTTPAPAVHTRYSVTDLSLFRQLYGLLLSLLLLVLIGTDRCCYTTRLLLLVGNKAVVTDR